MGPERIAEGPGHAGSPQSFRGSAVGVILVNVFFARSNSTSPATPAPPGPFTIWLTMSDFPSGVSSRSSGERVPQMMSMSPCAPHSIRGGAGGPPFPCALEHKLARAAPASKTRIADLIFVSPLASIIQTGESRTFMTHTTSHTRRGFVSGLTQEWVCSWEPAIELRPKRSPHLTPGRPTITLRIGPVLVDIAKDHTISTIGYNGSVPGPVIRMREGVPVIVDLFNDTDSPELVHWHGQIIPADVDGAAEEKSLVVPANGHLRYRLTPQPAGARWVHSHVMAMSDLSRGTYTGQFGFVYIEPKSNPGAYDQEIFLATHEWEPFTRRRKTRMRWIRSKRPEWPSWRRAKEE